MGGSAQAIPVVCGEVRLEWVAEWMWDKVVKKVGFAYKTKEVKKEQVEK